MFLSRLTLNLASNEVRRDIVDAYETHRTLTRSVADAPESVPGRYLWRQERAESGEAPVILMQSEVEPVFSRLPEGYLSEALTRDWNPVVANGAVLQLLVRACPEAKREGKRRPLRTTEEQVAWMQRQAVNNLGLDPISIGVTGSGVIRARRRQAGTIVALAAQFEGVVRVIDPGQLAAGIQRGVGHSKLLGLGMVSIKRLAL